MVNDVEQQCDVTRIGDMGWVERETHLLPHPNRQLPAILMEGEGDYPTGGPAGGRVQVLRIQVYRNTFGEVPDSRSTPSLYGWTDHQDRSLPVDQTATPLKHDGHYKISGNIERPLYLIGDSTKVSDVEWHESPPGIPPQVRMFMLLPVIQNTVQGDTFFVGLQIATIKGRQITWDAAAIRVRRRGVTT